MSRLGVQIPHDAPEKSRFRSQNDGATESQSAAGMVCGIPFHKDLPVGCDFECDG